MRDDAIRLARVPGRLAGAPRLRSGLERWLADCDPARHGLPAQAIVLVRRLRTHWSEVVDDDRAARYGSFAALLDGARRPAAGDSDADVVWFADEAELLACIARDALAGVLRARWWWRALGPGPAQSPPGVARWLQAPRQVPRAIERLGPARATAWLASWTTPEQAGLLSALAQAFPVVAAVATWVLEGRVQEQAAVPPAPRTAPAHAPGAGLSGTNSASGSSPAERIHQLCAELAVDAGAARAPASAADMAARLAARTGRPWPPPSLAGEAAPAAVRRAATPARTGGPAIAPRSRRASARVLGAVRAQASARTPAPQPPSERAARTGAMPASDDRLPPPAMAPPTVTTTAPAAIATGAALTDAPVRPAIATQHGGLFFVLNAALQLGLYGDFTLPAHQGLACTPWRFLWLAGRAWCGPSFRADPLAGWLAQRDTAASSSFRRRPLAADMDWRIDAAWLEPFPAAPAPWRARWQDGRFSLLHPAGFCVCDVAAAAGQCEALIASEAVRLGIDFGPRLRRTVVARHAGAAARARGPRQRHACPEPLWPYLHARLALALDDGTRMPPRTRVASLLNLPGRLRDGGERLDLDFPLDALPLPVRLAGLDRDPGWIPAAGCDLRFHFG